MANIVFEHLDTGPEWTRGIVLGKPPILAVAGPESDMGNILTRTQKGMLCSKSADVEKFLNIVESNPGSFAGNVEIVNEYSHRNQAKRLAAVLDEVLRMRA